MHIGSHRGMGREAGIARLIEGLRAGSRPHQHRPIAMNETGSPPTRAPMPRLVLENSAGTGDGIGAPLEDLADILDAAASAGLPTRSSGSVP